jgi:hypothetical protein
VFRSGDFAKKPATDLATIPKPTITVPTPTPTIMEEKYWLKDFADGMSTAEKTYLYNALTLSDLLAARQSSLISTVLADKNKPLTLWYQSNLV